MAHGDFKGVTRRIASDKILHDKAFHIAKNQREYQRGLASMVSNSFYKKLLVVILYLMGRFQ